MKSKFNLAEWQKRHGFTYDTAAKELGVHRATYARYLKTERQGKALCPLIELACKSIDARERDVPNE